MAQTFNIDTLSFADRYEIRFGNLDELLHPAVLLKPNFYNLLAAAIERGVPLTRDEVERVFGPISWEW